MFVCLFSTKQTTLATDICLLYLTILLLSYMDEHLVPTLFKHWLNLHYQLNYRHTQHHLLLFMVIMKKGEFSKIVCLKMLYPSCIYSRAILFIYWHLFKYAHIRYKINNSCWSSRYIMQYAFNMLIKACMYMKVYDECVCVYNWRGYLNQHCKPSRTEGKNISVQKTSTSLVSHLFSSLQSHPNAYDLRYLKIKRSHH